MKIAITGSSGFIGSHLSTSLSQDGIEVVGIDLRRPAEDYGINEFFQADVRKRETLLPALQGVDCVVNLAAIHFDSGHEDHEYFDTNEGGMVELLAAMQQQGVKKIVFTSSIAVYGDRDTAANEETDPAATKPYGASKYAAEKVLRKWVDESEDRQAVILRPCVVYGERNVANMNNLIRQIDSGFFCMFGRGDNIKATAYVGNIVAAIRHCMETLGPTIQLFNYCDEPAKTVREIVAVLRDALGKKGPLLRMPLWLGSMAAIPFDVVSKVTGRTLPVSRARVKKLVQPTIIEARKIRSAGLKQQFTSEQGLRRTVEYYLSRKK